MTEMGSAVDLVSRLHELLPEGVVSIDPASLELAGRSTALIGRGWPPVCIVQPTCHDELQRVMDFANQAGLNLTVTSSTGYHRMGGMISFQENILIDLSQWKKIDLIDRRNRVCRIEPGVTYGQLLAALQEHGMVIPVPLAPRCGKSVLAAVMDRQPTTWPNKQWDSSDPAGSTEFFFGNGERFRTGSGGGPGTIEQQRQSGGAQKFSSGPSQTDFHRVLQGAQGTMGILTWITLRTEIKPSLQKSLITGSDHLADLLPFVYAVQRGLLGEQTFILDRTAAAMLMAEGDPKVYDAIHSSIPAFVCLQNVAGFERLPRERLTYHLQEINQLAQQSDLHLEENLGSLSAGELYTRASRPCGEVDWRDQLRGGSLSIFFLTTLNKTPGFQEIITAAAREFGIYESEIGTYIQPMVQNHACHMEFILPCNPAVVESVERMRWFEKQAVLRLMEAGAFFSRPYGSAAELVWAQNPGNYQLVKTVKGLFDPQRILQRGKWGL